MNLKTKLKVDYAGCPRCGKAEQTQSWDVEDGHLVKTDCKKCGFWRMGNTKERNEPLSGEWSRHKDAELMAHSKDTLQPLTKNGRINKNFIQAHGTKVLEKETKLTKQEIMAQAE